MDPTAAGNAAAAIRTVGGRPVNTSGGQGRRPKKKPSFARDARLARDGARLMTGPFRPPGEPPVFTPTADRDLSGSTRKKAYTVRTALANNDETYVTIAKDMLLTKPGSQDVLNICVTQASLEMQMKK